MRPQDYVGGRFRLTFYIFERGNILLMPCVYHLPLDRENAMSRMLIVVAALVGLFIVSTARADIILFANIQNSLENPPTNPTTSAAIPRPSFGSARFVFDREESA